MRFIPYNPDQAYLLPPSVRDVLGERHLCIFVHEVVERLDWSALEQDYEEEGRPASGKRVALVESREVVGGACINTGTIHSKTLREAVLHLSGYKYQSIYGVNYRVKEKITMADLAFRVQHVIKTEIDVTNAQLSRNTIDLLTGTASFLDPRHVSKGSF